VKPVSSCVAALAALAFAAAAEPAAALAGDPQEELAQRFVPVVRLVEQAEPCAHGEPFEPTDLGLVLGNPGVALRGPWDGTNLVEVAPTGHRPRAGALRLPPRFPGQRVVPTSSPASST